jgi:hypothetical protein
MRRNIEAVRAYYTCSARRRKGPSVCESAFAFSVEGIDHVFLDAIEETVLSPTFVERVLDAAFAGNPDVERESLTKERQRLATEITNLTTAITAGGDIPALVKALAERDRQLKIRREARQAAHLAGSRCAESGPRIAHSQLAGYSAWTIHPASSSGAAIPHRFADAVSQQTEAEMDGPNAARRFAGRTDTKCGVPNGTRGEWVFWAFSKPAERQ